MFVRIERISGRSDCVHVLRSDDHVLDVADDTDGCTKSLKKGDVCEVLREEIGYHLFAVSIVPLDIFMRRIDLVQPCDGDSVSSLEKTEGTVATSTDYKKD